MKRGETFVGTTATIIICLSMCSCGVWKRQTQAHTTVETHTEAVQELQRSTSKDSVEVRTVREVEYVFKRDTVTNLIYRYIEASKKGTEKIEETSSAKSDSNTTSESKVLSYSERQTDKMGRWWWGFTLLGVLTLLGGVYFCGRWIYRRLWRWF